MKFEILVSITTDWRSKVAEMKDLGINKVALFPPLLPDERAALYHELKTIPGLEMPHIHLVNGMEPWEMDFFRDYGAVAFNIHQEYFQEKLFQDNNASICIENRFRTFPFGLSREFAGICIDYSHAEMGRTIVPSLEPMDEIPEDIAIGCAHISAYPVDPIQISRLLGGTRDEHPLVTLNELDYMKNYRHLLPRYVSMEINNPLSEQLLAKKYLLEMVLQ